MAHRLRSLAILTLLLASCDSESPTDTDGARVATAIVLSPSALSFGSLGASEQLTAEVRDQHGDPLPSAPVAWSPSDAAIATVSTSGVVTAVANGSAGVTAASGAASATVAIEVSQVAASLVLSSDTIPMESLGETSQLTAVVEDARGTVIPGATVGWVSADEAVATVSATGLVTSRGNGTTSVTATSGSASSTASVTVQQVPTSVTVTPPPPPFLIPGATLQLSAVALDALGSTVAGAAPEWASSNPAAATVSAEGLVTGIAEGMSVITATVSSVSGTTDVTVTDQMASYKVTFNATWSAATHPTSFPPNPHFSGLIGGAHNASVTFWEEGSIASDGIKDMAERGQKGLLDAEVQAAIAVGNAGAVISGGGISLSPGVVEMTFAMNADFPLVTLVSMIAPSPDWFVGVGSLSLLENGSWADSIVVQLHAYDAGTDSGTIYTSPNDPTAPRVGISRLTTSPFDVTASMGTFVFTRQ